jgi:hypothetical protein
MEPGSHSAPIRDTLQAGLRQPARWEPVDIDEMRRVVFEELGWALAGGALVFWETDPCIRKVPHGRAGDRQPRQGGCGRDLVIVWVFAKSSSQPRQRPLFYLFLFCLNCQQIVTHSYSVVHNAGIPKSHLLAYQPLLM